MLIKSIKLNNIRSYTNDQIDFPAGSVLLSGDIGTGKSTILLAIEFALFGTKRTELPASALLRNDKKEGSVELKFDIEGKEFIVNRKLKRGKNDIKQDAGYLIADGRKKDLTPVELRAHILELLGYPKELVTKSKDLIYRYTVYTPQEQMKQILLEDKDIRLDTLRKVFNIDKYKLVKENTSVFVKSLREKIKKLEGETIDLVEKKKQRDTYEIEFLNSKVKIDELRPKLKQVKESVSIKKEEISKVEADIKEFVNLKKELELRELDLRNKLEKRQYNKSEIEKLITQLDVLKKEVEGKDSAILDQSVIEAKQKEDAIGLIGKSIIEINNKISSFETLRRQAADTQDKISKLSNCPLCKQDVGEEHKKAIIDKTANDTVKLNDGILTHKAQLKDAEAKVNSLKEELSKLREKQKELAVVDLKQKNIVDKTKMMEQFALQQDLIKKEIGKINVDKVTINEKIEALKNIEADYIKLKKELDAFIANESEVNAKLASLTTKHEDLNKIVSLLKKEIDAKLKVQKDMNKLMQTRNWLEKYFVKLADIMEKHVMSKVHTEFNDFFREWFNVLIEDETLNVRLDDEFTPLIEQNGYETNVLNLSGGEKTAVALAYRLATG
jgi:exonuclease SbcC